MTTNVAQGQPPQDTPTPLPQAEEPEPKRESARTDRSEVKADTSVKTNRDRLAEINEMIDSLTRIGRDLKADQAELPGEIDSLNKEVDRLEHRRAPEEKICVIGRKLGNRYVQLEAAKHRLPIIKGELRKLESERDKLVTEMKEQGEVSPEFVGFSDHRDDEAMARMEHAESQGKKRTKETNTVADLERSLKQDLKAGRITKAECRERLKAARRSAKARRKGKAEAKPKKSDKKKDKDSRKADKKKAKHAA